MGWVAIRTFVLDGKTIAPGQPVPQAAQWDHLFRERRIHAGLIEWQGPGETMDDAAPHDMARPPVASPPHTGDASSHTGGRVANPQRARTGR